jgi:D-alanyl-D-alanine carboxypeptidase
MNKQRNRHDRRTARFATKTLALASAVALIGAACGSDSPEAMSEPTTAETAASTPVTSDTGGDSNEAADEPAAAGVEAAPATMAAGDIEMTATIDFEQGGGTWEVAAGADILGCDGGSFTDQGFAAGEERTATCDAGPGSGAIVFRFSPEPSGPESNEFVSDWKVHSATGDFAGLQGGGDWSSVLDRDNGSADENWTGSVEFGDPGDHADIAGEVDLNAPDVELDESFLVGLMHRLDVPDDAEGTVSVAVIDADGTSISTADGNTPDDALPGPADPMRIGSITKVFTSLATLSLVADGSIALDDAAADHVSRVSVPDGVTIRDLLQHTSGIPEHVVADFGEDLFADHGRVWTPEEVVGRVDGMELDFEPGEQFGYSNTNYIILGILIEEVTGRPAHEVIRERVIDVVDMPTTYLDGVEDGPDPVAAFSGLPEEPTALIDFDYTSIATAAWTAGAMVSSGDDLHDLFTALVAGDIIPDELVADMIANEEYGLGIEPWDEDDSLIGHGGSIFGYGTLVFHDPASGQTAFWASTSDRLTWGPIVEDTVMAMVPGLDVDDER